jgi:hypothetical protein
MKSCPDVTRGKFVLEKLAQSASASGASPYDTSDMKRTAVSNHAYRLISGEVLRGLTDVSGSQDQLRLFLGSADRRSALWGEDPGPWVAEHVATCDPSGTLPCTAAWSPSSKVIVPHRGRQDVWTHEDYWQPGGKDYQNDFKRHLFKQFGIGLGYQMWAGNGMSGVVGRVSGSILRLVPESSIDLGVWFDGLHDSALDAHGLSVSRPWGYSVTYNAYRTSYRGAYVGALCTRAEPEVTHVRLEALPSTDDTPATDTDVIQTYRSNLTLYTGYSVGFAIGAWKLTLRAGVHGSLIRGTSNTAHNSVRPAGIHVAAEFMYGFRNDPHPLTR